VVVIAWSSLLLRARCQIRTFLTVPFHCLAALPLPMFMLAPIARLPSKLAAVFVPEIVSVDAAPAHSEAIFWVLELPVNTAPRFSAVLSNKLNFLAVDETYSAAHSPAG